MTPDELAACKYVSLTTYRRDGTTKALPIWIAPLGESTLCFTTERESYKVKRIEHEPRLLLQPCDARGNVDPDHAPLEGRARIVLDDEASDVRNAISRKYGWQLRLFEVLGAIGEKFGRHSGERCGVVIEFRT